MGLAVLFWAVQRSTQTGTLITYGSFDHYAEALKHKAELGATAKIPNHVSVVTIETLHVGEVQRHSTICGHRQAPPRSSNFWNNSAPLISDGGYSRPLL